MKSLAEAIYGPVEVRRVFLRQPGWEPPVIDDEAFWRTVDALLPPRYGVVLRKRYQEGLTFEAVGREFHVTRERIRQIDAKALRMMRHPSRRKLFEVAVDV